MKSNLRKKKLPYVQTDDSRLKKIMLEIPMNSYKNGTMSPTCVSIRATTWTLILTTGCWTTINERF